MQTDPGGCLAYVVRIDRPRELLPGQAPFSPMASLRLRTFIPGSELARRLKVVLVPFDQFLEDPGLATLGSVRAAVIGKLSVSEVETMAWRRDGLFNAVQQCPYPLFADFSDNYAALGHSRSPLLVDYQARMASLVSLTVPCAALAEQLRPQAAYGVEVVEDPYELAEMPAVFAPQHDALRLCWFGASYDAESLSDSFVSIAASLRAKRLRVDFVTAPAHRYFPAQLAGQLSAVHPSAELRFIEWSPSNVATALQDCDLVVLPQDPRSEWARGKSHNRLVQAIRAGRIALASAIPSFVELADFACVGDDLPTLAHYALAHRSELLERVRAGQAYVRGRFAPERIAARWAEVLGLG
jgi:hypothetical protein